MAIIKCKECGHTVSDTAEFCPNCGADIFYSLPAEKRKEIEREDRVLDLLYGLFLAVLGLYLFYYLIENSSDNIWGIVILGGFDCLILLAAIRLIFKR